MEDWKSYLMSSAMYREVKKIFAMTVAFSLSIVGVCVFPPPWYTIQYKNWLVQERKDVIWCKIPM